MPMPNNHEVGSSLTFRNFLTELLNKGRFPSLDNSTHHYSAILLRGLLTYNMTSSNNSRMDNNTDYEQDLAADGGHDDCSPFMDVFDFLHLYYIPAIILTGLVGNLLSCVVFLNTHLKMRSSSYYLAALSVADFGFLATLLLVWLNSSIGVQVFNKEGWCQALVYISSVCSFLSVWLIVAFTVERFIAIQYPLHRPRMCTVARAKAIVSGLAVVAMLSHLYSFVTAGIVKQSDGSEICDMLEECREIMRIINIIDSLVTLIIPLILIIVMNTMIGRNLLKFRKRFRQNQETTPREEMSMERSDINLNQINSSSSNNRKHSQHSFHSTKSNNSRQMQPKNNHPESVTPSNAIHVRSSSRSTVSTRAQQNITKMLLLISTVFVLLNLPSYVIRIYVFVSFSLWHQNIPTSLWCLQQYFMFLYYTNFSINFLLYSVWGVTFRRCMFQLIRKNLKSLSRYDCNPQRYI